MQKQAGTILVIAIILLVVIGGWFCWNRVNTPKTSTQTIPTTTVAPGTTAPSQAAPLPGQTTTAPSPAGGGMKPTEGGVVLKRR